MNRYIVSGNLTRDPEQRSVGDKTVTTFSIAATSGFGDKKKTFYPRISVWGARGNSVMRFCHKGSKVYIEGDPFLNEYEGRDGKMHASLEVIADNVEIIFDSRTGNNGAASAAPAPAKSMPEPVDEDDELPF